MDKTQRDARRQQEDQALNRALLWVGAAIVLEALLLLVNRYYINFLIPEVDTAILVRSVLGVLRVAGGIAAAAGLVWSVLQLRRGSGWRLPVAVTLLCAEVALCAHVVVKYVQPGIQMAFLLVPALAGLALVFYLYQREFFLSACVSAMAGLGLWFIRYGGVMQPEPLVLVVLICAVFALALALKKNHGALKLGEQTVQFLPPAAGLTPVFASALVGLAVMAAAMLMGRTAAYYLIFAIVAWIFALLVYYTVKLM